MLVAALVRVRKGDAKACGVVGLNDTLRALDAS